MYHKTEAIVLRTVDFSETSLIVTFFSRNFGKIHTLAKGGRRLKGPFESALDLMAQTFVTFIPKRGGALDLLTEAKLHRRFCPEERNFSGMYAGYYVIELLENTTVEGNPQPELYDEAAETLKLLADGVRVMPCLMRFEWRLLQEIGMFPSLEACVQCGGKMPENPGRTMTFTPIDGGVICSECRVGKPHLMVISAELASTVIKMAELPAPLWNSVSLPVLRQMRQLLNHYISHLLGKRPKMFDYFKTMAERDKDVQNNTD
ncbi:MAG: DNA repair protein RecO [Planctomycetaceae bacterium]|jgi:DNA repair protein RecO (recombination protein O)|nr:DNA repair protein RecO [Planctomycetaceae bacterium]